MLSFLFFFIYPEKKRWTSASFVSWSIFPCNSFSACSVFLISRPAVTYICILQLYQNRGFACTAIYPKRLRFRSSECVNFCSPFSFKDRGSDDAAWQAPRKEERRGQGQKGAYSGGLNLKPFGYNMPENVHTPNSFLILPLCLQLTQ